MGFVVFPRESTDAQWRGWGGSCHKHSPSSRTAQLKAKCLCKLKVSWMKQEHRTTSSRPERTSSEGQIYWAMLCLGETACLAGGQSTRSVSRWMKAVLNRWSHSSCCCCERHLTGCSSDQICSYHRVTGKPRWAIPYTGHAVGQHLLQQPVGRLTSSAQKKEHVDTKGISWK